MKINAVITARRIKMPENKFYNISAFISAIPIGMGIIFGCVVYLLFGEQIKGELWDFFISFTTEFIGKTKTEILTGLILSNVPYLLFMYLFGTNLRGTYLTFTLSFFKSFGLGLLSSYIFSTYALKGIEYCLLIFFPGKVLMIFSMLLLTDNCYNASLKLSDKVKEKNDSHIDLIRYDLRTIFISVLVVLSCVVDFVMIICFSTLFDFV